jgi:hypothetical protein
MFNDSNGIIKLLNKSEHTSGIDSFFILGLKNQLYGNEENQIPQNFIKLYWR